MPGYGMGVWVGMWVGVSSLDVSGVRGGGSFAGYPASCFCCFVECLGLVAWGAEPLEVVELVVVAGLDVVALGADAVAGGYVVLGLAHAPRPFFDGSSTPSPVPR